jgi:hypothetical protein
MVEPHIPAGVTKKNKGNVLELGYTLCKLEEAAPVGYLNYNNPIVLAARIELCGYIDPPKQLNADALAILAGTARTLGEQNALALGYIPVYNP